MKLNEAHQEILMELVDELDLHHIVKGSNLAELTWDEYKRMLEMLEFIRDTREDIVGMNQFINNKEEY